MRILLLSTLIICSLSSCKNISHTMYSNNGKIEISSLRDSVIDDNSTIQSSRNLFTSDLRINENLEQGIVYSDTVKFVTFDTPGDYDRITVSKNGKECFLLNSIDNDTLLEGDSIIIKWNIVSNHALEDTSNVWLELHLIQLEKLK